MHKPGQISVDSEKAHCETPCVGQPDMQESWSQENYSVMHWGGVKLKSQMSDVEYIRLLYWPGTTVLFYHLKRSPYLLGNSQDTSFLCSSGLLIFMFLATRRPDLNWED